MPDGHRVELDTKDFGGYYVDYEVIEFERFIRLIERHERSIAEIDLWPSVEESLFRYLAKRRLQRGDTRTA